MMFRNGSSGSSFDWQYATPVFFFALQVSSFPSRAVLYDHVRRRVARAGGAVSALDQFTQWVWADQGPG